MILCQKFGFSAFLFVATAVAQTSVSQLYKRLS